MERIAKVSEDTKLNVMQERFCVEWCVDGNGTQAAIRAGYKSKTAAEQSSRLLTLHKIKKRINELSEPVQAEIVDHIKVDKEWVVNAAVKIAKNGMQEVITPLKDKSGCEVYKMLDSRSASNAISLIADVLAMKTNTNLNINLTSQEVLAEVERRQVLATSHVETPILKAEDSLYLPKSVELGDNHG